ncbi:hypothetical protein LXL04_009821 [Taraxacum kok-saghyz]
MPLIGSILLTWNLIRVRTSIYSIWVRLRGCLICTDRVRHQTTDRVRHQTTDRVRHQNTNQTPRTDIRPRTESEITGKNSVCDFFGRTESEAKRRTESGVRVRRPLSNAQTTDRVRGLSLGTRPDASRLDAPFFHPMTGKPDDMVFFFVVYTVSGSSACDMLLSSSNMIWLLPPLDSRDLRSSSSPYDSFKSKPPKLPIGHHSEAESERHDGRGLDITGRDRREERKGARRAAQPSPAQQQPPRIGAADRRNKLTGKPVLLLCLGFRYLHFPAPIDGVCGSRGTCGFIPGECGLPPVTTVLPPLTAAIGRHQAGHVSVPACGCESEHPDVFR